MTDRCDCPYPDPMTYGGPNPLCPEHGDVDAILASGVYVDVESILRDLGIEVTDDE